jgi:hypothetical protein
MARTPLTRVQKLAKRVGWLDRHRRAVACIVTIAASPLIFMRVYEYLGGGDWPKLYALLVGIIASIAVWAITEVALAWVTAMWETELVEKTRDGELPRAVVRARK